MVTNTNFPAENAGQICTSCSKEGEGNNRSDGFLDNNFMDKTIVVAGSTINDGAVIWINNKKVSKFNR